MKRWQQWLLEMGLASEGLHESKKAFMSRVKASEGSGNNNNTTTITTRTTTTARAHVQNDVPRSSVQTQRACWP
eukprot:1848304-Lingulodinium_polyedra.AAC.2